MLKSMLNLHSEAMNEYILVFYAPHSSDTHILSESNDEYFRPPTAEYLQLFLNVRCLVIQSLTCGFITDKSKDKLSQSFDMRRGNKFNVEMPIYI